ncbi:nmrA-like family domain-containing protein 1 [Penicillium chrysogenum]|uniref:NmrA-like family domain-containing protein 1 n=1 Tax=Penicillium chrysogenum TaxID=5076 RepID=A0ABQ8WNE6_PENCH|nr:nmrA-like family domain-containing protein 1 [Penicillium chrysogenum]KAJ6155932.1 nmrA-like family domain-containing protein 1 [Penicillium chrysogenum]
MFALPVPETAPIPLFDARNAGIWVKAIVRKRDQLLGKRVLGATKYTTPADGFKQAFPEASKVAGFFSLPYEMFLQGFKDSTGVSHWAAVEFLEMMRLVYEDGYFGPKSRWKRALGLLEDKPIVWVDFLKKNKTFKDLR